MLAQSSELQQFVEYLDNEVVGAILILGTIGFFLTTIVLIVTIARTWNNISMARMNQRMVAELLKQGYSVDDIDRLVYGGPRWGQRFSRMFQSAKRQFTNAAGPNEFTNQPMPPVKQPTA